MGVFQIRPAGFPQQSANNPISRDERYPNVFTTLVEIKQSPSQPLKNWYLLARFKSGETNPKKNTATEH